MAEKSPSKIVTLIIGLIKLISLLESTTALMSTNQKTWTYELKSIDTKTSDPSKIDFNLEIERVSRGIYAISGDFMFNLDIIEGDSNNVGAKSYRSSLGNDDYKVLPFQMSSSHFFNVLNTYYKNVLLSTLKDCSNLPYFEDKFEPPLEKKIYKLESCQFSQDGLPNHLQDGFYKISILATGEVEWQIDIIVEVTQVN